jgi:hypothetical protein
MMKTKLTLFVTVLAVSLQQGYSQGEVNLKKGLVAHYLLDGDAKDMSKNKLDGTIHNAKSATGKNGDKNGAFQFNKDAWITIGKHDKILPNINLTWSAWVKKSGEDSWGTVLWDDDPSGGGDRFIGILPDGRVHFGDSYRVKESLYNTRISKGRIGNEWNHLCFVTDGEIQKGYINGKLDLLVGVPLPNHAGRSFLSIGAGHNGYPGPDNSPSQNPAVGARKFKGSIDDVRIYNRALSAAEVKALYDLEKPKGK